MKQNQLKIMIVNSKINTILVLTKYVSNVYNDVSFFLSWSTLDIRLKSIYNKLDP